MIAALLAVGLMAHRDGLDASFEGIWADIDGNFVSLAFLGGIRICLADDFHFYMTDSIARVDKGLYSLTWYGDEKIQKSTSGGFGGPSLGGGGFSSGGSTTRHWYFSFDKSTDSRYVGDGYLRFGQPNNRNQIKSFDLVMKRGSGGTLISAPYGFVCPASAIDFSGSFKDDVYEMTLSEGSSEEGKEVVGLEGQFGVNGYMYEVKGNRRNFAGEATLLDPKLKTELGKLSIVWAPTQGRVLDMLKDDDFHTNNMRIIVKMNNNPTGVRRNLKRKK